MPAFIDRTGQTFNDITIIKELGKKQVIGRCDVCGRESIYNKQFLVSNKQRCHYKGCDNKRKRTITKCTIGETFNNITIVKELGDNKVIGNCGTCGREEIYSKQALTEKILYCKYADCMNKGRSSFVNRVGQTFNNITIVEELGESKVKGRCNICGRDAEYKKSQLIHSKLRCIYGDCDNSSSLKFVDMVGREFNTLKIIKELGYNMVLAKCYKCNSVCKYKKSKLIKGDKPCDNCGVAKSPSTWVRIEGHTINNVQVTKYEYRGRSGKLWYKCKCLHCGEELLLDYDSIFTYVCDKR